MFDLRLSGPCDNAVPLQVERVALKWAEGLAGLKPEGLHRFYETSTAQIKVPRTGIEVPHEAMVFMQSVLYVEDVQLLHACSTSPDAEQPDFCAGALSCGRCCDSAC
jgi:Protein N-terminal asparagine amidohydrolase